MSNRVYRYPEGIGLNGKEFLLTNEGKIMLFNTVFDAVKYVGEMLEVEATQAELEDDYGIHVEENVDA